jgi:hypothetical protein
MPLGLMSGVSYEEGRNLLREGDGILFYSDGLVEAHNPNREMFGSPRLHRLILDMMKEDLWVTSSWRSSTPSPGRVGSRRTTSPSLRYGLRRPDSVPEKRSGD